MEAAVVGIPDVEALGARARATTWSRTRRLPRAYVVRMARANISAEEVKTFVEGQARAVQAAARGGVVFVDELPKNTLNKILRRELRDRARVEIRGERACRSCRGWKSCASAPC